MTWREVAIAILHGEYDHSNASMVKSLMLGLKDSKGSDEVLAVEYLKKRFPSAG